MSPVTQGIEVPEVQARLLAELDICYGTRNLPGDECAATARRLVVEQDSVARVHPIRLAVVHRDPVRVEFRAAVWRTWVERCGLALRRLDDLAVKLRGGGLVEPDVLLESAGADRVEQAQSTQAINIPGVLGHFE